MAGIGEAAGHGSQQPSLSVRGTHEQYFEAKRCQNYLKDKKVPEIFQSLVASLMMERPDDHLKFLDDKLEVIKETGFESINWETFIYQLHPMRDQLRKTYIKDGKYEEKKEEEDKTQSNGKYEPDVFQLTEAVPYEEDDNV